MKWMLVILIGSASIVRALPETAVTTLSFDTTDGAGGNSQVAISPLSFDSRDYELKVKSTFGSPVPAVGNHTYSWGTTVTCSVDRLVYNGGEYFQNQGWSVEPGMSGPGNEFVIQLSSLETDLQWSWKNIHDADYDNDGFNDIWEVQNGLNPEQDNSALLTYIQNNEAQFGLYSSNALLGINLGDMGLAVSNGIAGLSLQLEQSSDLQSWTNAGDAVHWAQPVGAEKKFFRVRANP